MKHNGEVTEMQETVLSCAYVKGKAMVQTG